MMVARGARGCMRRRLWPTMMEMFHCCVEILVWRRRRREWISFAVVVVHQRRRRLRPWRAADEKEIVRPIAAALDRTNAQTNEPGRLAALAIHSDGRTHTSSGVASSRSAPSPSRDERRKIALVSSAASNCMRSLAFSARAIIFANGTPSRPPFHFSSQNASHIARAARISSVCVCASASVPTIQAVQAVTVCPAVCLWSAVWQRHFS